MWFQRLVEIDDESEPEPVPTPFERPTAVRSSVRTKKPKVAVSTPADFQRVRLMSTLRLREQKGKENYDKVYVKALEEDLRQTGLDQKEIDRILNEYVDTELNRPTFTRMSRRHLSIETLNKYRLDYEFDEVGLGNSCRSVCFWLTYQGS
jgi:hypothetical protein